MKKWNFYEEHEIILGHFYIYGSCWLRNFGNWQVSIWPSNTTFNSPLMSITIEKATITVKRCDTSEVHFYPIDKELTLAWLKVKAMKLLRRLI